MNTQDLILNIVYSIGITNIFVLAEPIILLKEFLGFKEDNYPSYKPFKKYIFRLITCALCSGVFISASLFASESLSLKEFIGLICASAVLSELINRKLR